MLIKPKPGARQDVNAANSVDELVNHSYNFAPRGNAGNHFELLSHCKDKDPMRAQQDDGVTGSDWPVKDSELKPRTGGPVTSVKQHK